MQLKYHMLITYMSAHIDSNYLKYHYYLANIFFCIKQALY